MKIGTQIVILLVLLLQFHAAEAGTRTIRGEKADDAVNEDILDEEELELANAVQRRAKRGKGGGKGMGKYSNYFVRDDYTLTLTIINESFNQPFSEFFVMVHNRMAEPLYRRGQPASAALARLAEDGTAMPLMMYYRENSRGVHSVSIHNDNAPYVGGESTQIEVRVSPRFPMVTIATMAINTNDCFVSVNGVALSPGDVLDLPGLDAGSEENNEMCNSIPGPGCPMGSGNVASGNGEGFVHVHRGFHGVGNLLPQSRYDWRNPMMRVVVSR